MKALQDFDLSHFHSLRSIEVYAYSFCEEPFSSLRSIFSTITSPGFYEIILTITFRSFIRLDNIPFGIFHEMYSKRKFRLVFCIEAWDKMGGGVQLEEMRRMVDSEIARGRLDFLASPPTLAIREQNTWGFSEIEYLK